MKGMEDGIKVFIAIEKGTALTNTLLQKIIDQSLHREIKL
jgi:hypothetical protein